MINLLIGKKESFGIEVIIESQNQHGYYLGYGKLWFGGDFLGTIEDYIYINSYLLKGLQRMLVVPQLNDHFFQNSQEKFVYFMNRDNDLSDDEVDKFKINFGTMSDSFNIRVYRKSDELIILWKLWKEKEKIEFSDLKNYGNDIHEYQISITEFSKNVSVLEKIISLPDLLSQ